MPTDPAIAKQVMRDLLDASRQVALVEFESESIESVERPGEIMLIPEAEAHVDTVIRGAWKLLTGTDLAAEDPVSFIMDGDI